MRIKPTLREVVWGLVLAGTLAGAGLVGHHLHRDERDLAEQLAAKAQRLELVRGIQLALAAASEAEKSSVMALTDEESQRFADQARASSAAAEEQRASLERALLAHESGNERELLEEFTEAFARLRGIDDELLALSVKNTNLKAYALAFGPASSAIDDMDAALSRLIDRRASSAEGADVVQHALGAQSAALRLETLLAPHVAEESDAKMDALEQRMDAADRSVREQLAGLAAIALLRDDPDLAAATDAYARFSAIRRTILALSRENTNVRSLAISLDQKRKMTLRCQAALDSLRQAILDERITGANYDARAGTR